MSRLSCSEALEDLLDFVEGSLEPSPRRLVMEHMQACRYCGHVLATYTKTQSLCRRALKRELPAGMSERLFAVLREKTSASTRP